MIFLFEKKKVKCVRNLWKFLQCHCQIKYTVYGGYFAGKPKLFFIQACRGSKGEGYVTAGEKADNIQEADDIQEDEADEIIKIPHEADTLVAYATAKGNNVLFNVIEGKDHA